MIYGTNTRGMPVVDRLSSALGIPVIDSVAAGFMGACVLAGVAPP